MGFLDSVRDALRGAVSTRSSKDEEQAAAALPEDHADDGADVPAAVPPSIPVEPADAPESGEKFDTYTVKAGDTLSEICAREGVSFLEIARINSIENPDLIFPGQVFRIPKKN